MDDKQTFSKRLGDFSLKVKKITIREDGRTSCGAFVHCIDLPWQKAWRDNNCIKSMVRKAWCKDLGVFPYLTFAQRGQFRGRDANHILIYDKVLAPNPDAD